MKILHVTRDFPPRSTGGLSTAVGGMVAALADAGIESAVLSFDAWRPSARGGPAADAPRESRPGAEVARISTPAMLASARAFAREARPDLVHVHHDMLWEIVAELGRELGVPAVASVHVAQLRQNQLRGISEATASLRGQEALLCEADAVIVPSAAAARAVCEHVPAVSARLEVIPLGIADSETARDAARRPDRREPGLIVYVGRFADINGTAELWQALPIVLTRHAHARAVVAGGVPENRRAERRWIERWRGAPAANLGGFQGRVDFAGWLDETALSDLYARAGVVVSASWFETFGQVVLEAMLFGSPIVATRCGGVESLVDDGQTARVCEPRDPASLASAISELIDDRPLALRLGAAAAVRARSQLGWLQPCRELSALYERTIAAAR